MPSEKRRKRKPKRRVKGRRKAKQKLRPFRLLIVIFAVIMLVYGVSFFLSIIFNAFFASQPVPEPVSEPAPTEDPIYKNSYSWNHLREEDGFYYYEDENYTSRIGIDVSHYQGNIDWNAVHEAGIEFAFIRAGYRGNTTGILHEDTGYRKNIQGALDAGVEVAVYFFSQANGSEEGREEAEFLMNLIRDYPVHVCAYDLEVDYNEGRLADTTQDKNTEAAIEFCQAVKENGYTPLVYGSVSFLTSEVRMRELQDLTQFWLAWYDDAEPPFPYVFTIWQYSCEGEVPGINAMVDLNLLLVPKNPAPEDS